MHYSRLMVALAATAMAVLSSMERAHAEEGYDDDMTCATYLQDLAIQRDAVMGTWVYVYIVTNELDHNEAGRMIASNTTPRKGLDALCKGDPEAKALDEVDRRI